MTVKDSQKKAARKWDAQNMKVLGCRVRREVADAFAEYAQERGTTVNALLQKYVMACVGDRTDDAGDAQ